MCNIWGMWGTVWQHWMLFVVVDKIANHIWLWNTVLTLILSKFVFIVLDIALAFSFWPTWHCLIAEVLATWVKFLDPSGYCTVIGCALLFCTTNVYDCFQGIKHLLPNFCMFICAAFKSREVKQYTKCQYSNYLDPTNHCRCLPWL